MCNCYLRSVVSVAESSIRERAPAAFENKSELATAESDGDMIRVSAMLNRDTLAVPHDGGVRTWGFVGSLDTLFKKLRSL